MDEEDIPASFPGEEEWEAFADHDDLENEPACKCCLLFYTFKQKKKNVGKAY
jgi:hypothetical protein